VQAAKQFFRAESRLLAILQRMDAEKAYRDLGRTSLFEYAVQDLKLSESVALNLIGVARKSVQVPELKREIDRGELSVSMARKIVPVLTPQNQGEWIEKAKTLTTRALEKEVARVRPQEATPERYRYVTESRIALSLGFDDKSFQALKRVQDLESQRLRRAATLEEAVQAMTALYLERNDPVVRAERAEARARTRASAQDRKDRQKSEGSHMNGSDPSTQGSLQNLTLQPDRSNSSDVTGHATASIEARATVPDQQEPSQRQTKRVPIPAHVAHKVALRNRGQCTHHDLSGIRCASKRWLEALHVRLVSQGGANELDNLATLCFAHHKMLHPKGVA
jgi:hypothetical protein